MGAETAPRIEVQFKVLPAVRVAYISYKLTGGQPNFAAISECFQRVRAWLTERGIQPSAYLTIGASNFQGTPQVYDCCIQIPDIIESGAGEISVKELPGGRYAVLSIRKEPAVIGEMLRRFYHEYVPHNRLKIDSARLTYDIYAESTMEYCVPVME